MPTDPRAEYDALVAEMTAAAPVTSGKMMGMPCLKNDVGKMFAGFFQDAMVFKLGAPEHAIALALAGARLFDPSEMGRPMKEWVVVPVDHASRWQEFAEAALTYSAKAR